MTVQMLGVFLGILFLALLYLHYRVNTLTKKLKSAQTTSTIQLGVALALSQILIDKGILTDADFIEYSLTGKVTKKDVENTI